MTAATPTGRLAMAACAVFLEAFASACSPETINAVTSGDGRVAVNKMPDASRDHAVAPPDHSIAAPDVPGYHTEGTRIVDPSGNPYRIKAVSWYGLESNFAPLGLYTLSLDTILSQVQSLGFNTLRMTWSSEMLNARSMPQSINGNVNPDLAKLTTPLQVLDEVVHRAPKFGLKVILSRHQSSAGHQDPLWFNSDYPPERFNTDWVILAAHYAGDPTVIGCDLQSDLRGTATWGDGNPLTDWRAAAESAGNSILRANPAVLIIVQGIEKSSDGTLYWRGGNLKDAEKHPVNLDRQNRLVYATQDFARTANDAPGMPPPWFLDASYPTNLGSVWTSNWGYLLGGAPVLLAAFGTPNKDLSDQQWLKTVEQYIQGHEGLSFAFWALNSESSDVKGIYADSWNATNPDIISALQPVLGL